MHVVEDDERQQLLKEHTERTAQAIQQYREEKFAVMDSIEGIDDLVFYLLEKVRWEENLESYESSVVLLLKLLSLPDMATLARKHLLDRERTEISRMLYNLYDFFHELNSEQHRCALDLKFVEKHWADDNLTALAELEQRYRILLRMYLLEKSSRE